MYDLLSLPSRDLVSKDGDTAFTLREVETLLNRLLSRKRRNNGMGRHLVTQLLLSGSCHCDEFVCRRHEKRDYFQIALRSNPGQLLRRLNEPSRSALALEASISVRRERRRLRALGLYKQPKVQKPKAVAGASGRLKRHFHKRTITWGQAIAAIAYAARLLVSDVHTQLMETLNEKEVATLRLKGGFVFRLDTIGPARLISTDMWVEVRTTNNNRHASYRRLRSRLKGLLGIERRARTTRRASYEAMRLESRAFRQRSA